MDRLLNEIEIYYDAVPRSEARAETIGPFTLFVNEGLGEAYYARPSLGASTFSPLAVSRVLERQRSLGVPRAFEWVAVATPGLLPIIEAAGLAVRRLPLLVLDVSGRPPAGPSNVEVRLVNPEDDLDLHGAVAAIGFAHAGTATGEEGTVELVSAAAVTPPGSFGSARKRLVSGLTVTGAAYADGHPVSIGSYRPAGGASEIVGVATLPAYRRRGLASVVINLLIDDALRRGIRTIFLSADAEAVARIYERLGFRRIATACVAELSG